MTKLALRELYINELKDLFDAENRLLRAIPQMARRAESDDLRVGFEKHFEQTKGHLERLQEILDAMGERATGKKCAAMTGLIEEGDEMMEEEFGPGARDAALISVAQRVEHYEIAAYGCVKTWAGLLGETDAQTLLERTLQEEKETDEKLTKLSEGINVEALGDTGRGSDAELEEDSEIVRLRGKSRSARA